MDDAKQQPFSYYKHPQRISLPPSVDLCRLHAASTVRSDFVDCIVSVSNTGYSKFKYGSWKSLYVLPGLALLPPVYTASRCLSDRTTARVDIRFFYMHGKKWQRQVLKCPLTSHLVTLIFSQHGCNPSDIWLAIFISLIQNSFIMYRTWKERIVFPS